jgi:hypothetical protein
MITDIREGQACHNGSQQGVARFRAVWTGRSGGVTVPHHGFTGGEGLGAARQESLGEAESLGLLFSGWLA